MFDYEIDVAPDVLECRTLKFMVQPFVENAVFHGFAEDSRQYNLSVRVQRKGSDIQFTISDNGMGISEEQLSRLLQQEMSDGQTMNSIGVGNVSRRLKLHFGEKYGVTINSVKGRNYGSYSDP